MSSHDVFGPKQVTVALASYYLVTWFFMDCSSMNRDRVIAAALCTSDGAAMLRVAHLEEVHAGLRAVTCLRAGAGMNAVLRYRNHF